MMSCPLSLPLPLLPPDLHADYPPVHIGHKVSSMFRTIRGFWGGLFVELSTLRVLAAAGQCCRPTYPLVATIMLCVRHAPI